jgi:hypothetical protein
MPVDNMNNNDNGSKINNNDNNNDNNNNSKNSIPWKHSGSSSSCSSICKQCCRMVKFTPMYLVDALVNMNVKFCPPVKRNNSNNTKTMNNIIADYGSSANIDDKDNILLLIKQQ